MDKQSLTTDQHLIVQKTSVLLLVMSRSLSGPLTMSSREGVLQVVCHRGGISSGQSRLSRATSLKASICSKGVAAAAGVVQQKVCQQRRSGAVVVAIRRGTKNRVLRGFGK